MKINTLLFAAALLALTTNAFGAGTSDILAGVANDRVSTLSNAEKQTVKGKSLYCTARRTRCTWVASPGKPITRNFAHYGYYYYGHMVAVPRFTRRGTIDFSRSTYVSRNR